MENVIDGIVCPKCGSTHTTVCSTDEIDFALDGTGHYYVDVGCLECGRYFRKCYEFRYTVTAEAIR